MTDLIDITLPLSRDLPVWPTARRFKILPDLRMAEGGNSNTSSVRFNLHTGTHIDAPWHFIDDGDTVDQLALDDLLGPAVVAHLPGVAEVTVEALEALNLPSGMKRLLLRTDNSEQWASQATDFNPDFIAPTPQAAKWMVDHGIRLVGVDYLSVQCYYDGDDSTHQVLLRDHVVIVEGLNLHGVEPGDYELICLPLPITGADAAPARVLLRRTKP